MMRQGSLRKARRRLRAVASVFGAAALGALIGGESVPAEAAPPVSGPGPVVVYSPNLALHPDEDASYPRVIRLAHSGALNGVLLATFYHGGAGGRASLPIYRSDDGGRTWSAAPVGVVSDTVHGWDLEAPTLFELPEQAGDLPAGTLLAAGTAWAHGDFTRQTIEVFTSADHGATWRYRSACAQEDGMPDHEGLGIWEPAFAIAADHELVCYFSDERPSVQGFNQVLAHVASRDGGATWGPEVFDVAVRDGVQRPGMTTVVRLPDGRYAMTFEDCKKGFDPDTACSVYFKTSPDGLDWSPASGLGALVSTRDGRHFLHTPYLAWSAAGGGDGLLILSGQRIVRGEDGRIEVQPESGRVLMVNSRLGEGPWREIPAPVVVDPTGGYDTGETGCAGYSSPILADAGAPDFLYLAGVHLPNGKCEVEAGRGRLPPSGAPGR